MINLIAPISNQEEYITKSDRFNTPRIPLAPIVLASVLNANYLASKIYDLGLLSFLNNVDSSHFFDFSLSNLIISDFEIYGFSVTCTNIRHAILISEKLKAKKKNCIIMFGGPGATPCANYILNTFEFIDLVVRNEAESNISDIVTSLINHGVSNKLKDILGITYRIGSDVFSTPDQQPVEDLDTLPIPAYEEYTHILKELQNRYAFDMIFPLDIGRGCYGQCTFCSTTCFFKKKVRYKSTSRIINEIEKLKSLFNVSHFLIEHDCFVWNKDNVIDLSKAVKALPNSYKFDIAARADLVDDELIEYLKYLGCNNILIGLESGSNRIQKLIKKNLDVEKSLANILKLNKDFNVRVNFMIGFPEENKLDLHQTIKAFQIIKNAHIKTNIGLLSPFPGSELVRNRGLKSLCFDGIYPSVVDFPSEEDKPFLLKHRELCTSYYYYENENGIERLYYIFFEIMANMFNINPYISKLLFSINRLDSIYRIWKKIIQPIYNSSDRSHYFNFKTNAYEILIDFLIFSKIYLIENKSNASRMNFDQDHAQQIWLYDFLKCSVSFNESTYFVHEFMCDIPSYIKQNLIKFLDNPIILIFINSNIEQDIFIAELSNNNKKEIENYIVENSLNKLILPKSQRITF